MKSNLSKILPKLQEKFPDVNVELLINHYFDIAKQEVQDFTRPEIAFPWGTLVMKPKKVEFRIQYLDTLINNYNTPINELTPAKLNKYVLERNELKRVLEVHTQYKTKGKIKRNFKRDGKQYKKDKTQEQEL